MFEWLAFQGISSKLQDYYDKDRQLGCHDHWPRPTLLCTCPFPCWLRFWTFPSTMMRISGDYLRPLSRETKKLF